MIKNWAPKYLFNILKTTSGFVAKTAIATKIGMLKKVISLWSWLIAWVTLWWISIGIVICKWEFWIFDLLMANFSLLECFSTFHNYLYKGLCLFYLCMYVSLSVAMSGELAQIKNWFDFHFDMLISLLELEVTNIDILIRIEWLM